MVGCTITPTELKLNDDDLIGIWDNALPTENGNWFIGSYYFYGNNKCSILVAQATSLGTDILANEECSYSISGLNIYINGSLTFKYDEYNNELMRIDNSKLKYIKTDNNPCSNIYSLC